MNDHAIEQEIQAKGLTAPRVTPADIEANIRREVYFTAAEAVPEAMTGDEDPLHLLTFCVLVLRNGYTVHGHSAPASPENFDAEIGRKIARQKAVEQVWPLMGYELRSRLAGVAGEFTATDMSTARADGYRDGVLAGEEGTHL